MCHVEWIFVENRKGFFLKKGERNLDVSLGIDHRLTGEAADQEWNAYARKGK